mmetsp:Transcript_29312/g.76994  ORF Transcript_29312/g.76994 Transcript_29312/m.76994 type:complete len:251 (-) Transcript_29312:346-1098(-)
MRVARVAILDHVRGPPARDDGPRHVLLPPPPRRLQLERPLAHVERLLQRRRRPLDLAPLVHVEGQGQRRRLAVGAQHVLAVVVDELADEGVPALLMDLEQVRDAHSHVPSHRVLEPSTAVVQYGSQHRGLGSIMVRSRNRLQDVVVNMGAEKLVKSNISFCRIASTNRGFINLIPQVQFKRKINHLLRGSGKRGVRKVLDNTSKIELLNWPTSPWRWGLAIIEYVTLSDVRGLMVSSIPEEINLAILFHK